jgi:hypothetical protein
MSRFAFFLLVLMSLVLTACGGGADTVENPITTGTAGSDYTGPAPRTADVQSFRINLWENIKSGNRCGSCHGAGGQAPTFARTDDINLAYDAANSVVNLPSPPDSRMVTKVAGGHNCWEASDAACGTILTNWIAAWANNAGGGGKVITLEPPPIHEVGSSKHFPDDNGVLFGSTVHPLLKQFCSGCHSSTAITQQSPFFADNDVPTAYDAAMPKINLDNPADSRLVVRLRDEFHNCWSDCASNAAEMQARITDMSGQIPLDPIDPSLVVSKALTLAESTVASGGNRYDNNVVALYQFKTGSGTTAYDTSGVEPAVHLTLSGNVDWVGGWGINVKAGGKAQGLASASKKLHDLIKSTGEYSVEAWLAPGNVTQEDAYMVSYSGSNTARNFTMGQTLYNYDFLNRTTTTGVNGDPALSTADADEVLQASLQHAVMTYDPVNGRRIYVNGELVTTADPQAGGTLADWDDTFALVLGNEVSSDRQWQGVIRLVAIHNRALNQSQIQQNFDAGVGEKFFMLFSVEDIINVPQSYIMFEAQQFDSYSYLFYKPTFITLNNASPGSVPVKGIRLGVNGIEVAVGQAYRPVDTTITQSGQVLSDVGTIIALEKGPMSDEFFLSFDVLGGETNVRTEPVPLPPAAPPDAAPVSDIGLRTFDEINASMAAITGVSAATVKTAYDNLRQQLPTVENIDTFVSAHQMAITQLSVEYCNALVNNAALRSSFFGASTVDAGNLNAVATSLYNKMVGLPNSGGTALSTAPALADVTTELNALFGQLCPAGCTGTRNQEVMTGLCAAVLGSSTTLLQ